MQEISRRISVFIFFAFTFISTASALSGFYRCMWRDDPATTMVIAWNQVSGTLPTLYYDLVDGGTRFADYRYSQKPDHVVNAKGMNNHFVRLSNLQPNTVYYFVIRDSDGVSRPMSFQTAPNDPRTRLSIIAGGDSRNHREARIDANRMVSKLRPHCVMFGGDMTASDTPPEWKEWFADWQHTIGSDGRLFPIIPARGNHESSNRTLTDLFDVPSSDIYYSLTLGGDLLRIYTLNSLIPSGGSQKAWLEADLRSANNITWKFAQYHHTIRPHTGSKPERDELLLNWATLFHKYGLNLVMESDAHVVKTTYPIRPSRDPGSDEGFIRDDESGTIYVGEGCWGAPLRENNDDKAWTRNSGSFNQFKWIFVDQYKVELRTVRTDGSGSVPEVKSNDIFEVPFGLVLWNPSNGAVVTIVNKNVLPPPASNSLDPPIAGEAGPPDEVTADPSGNIRLKFELVSAMDVDVILTSMDLQELARVKYPGEAAGAKLKSLDLSKAPSGKYMILVKGSGKLIKRFAVSK